MYCGSSSGYHECLFQTLSLFITVQAHLDLVLLSCIFDRLEDIPRAPASHLQTRDILAVPALDQQSRSDRWRSGEETRVTFFFVFLSLHSVRWRLDDLPVAASQSACQLIGES